MRARKARRSRRVLAQKLDGEHAYATARTQVRELTFLAKLAEDIDAMLADDRRLMALFQISEPGESPAPHERKRAIGIDLGTTNSLVATVRNGLAVVLPDERRPPAAAVDRPLWRARRGHRLRRRWRTRPTIRRTRSCRSSG